MEVKGTAVASMPKFIVDKFGNEGLEKWLNAITSDARNVFNQNILASKWYSLEKILVEPTVKLCELYYDGNLQGAWDASRYSASYGLSGILKIFVKMGTPGFIISRAATILPSYYEPSEIKVVELVDTKCTIQITKFPELSSVIEHRIGGWIERALEIQGCKSVLVKITKSVSKNDPLCEYKILWS